MQQVSDFQRTQLVARAQKILMQPREEWAVIATEPSDAMALLRGYAAPLAAIPALCTWIGMSVFGVFGFLRVGLVRGLVSAIIQWIMALVGVYVAAVVIQKLAPTFQSKDDLNQAAKTVVYAMTPVWLAGVLYLFPVLSPLVIIAALYSIYLFYLALPPVMSTPQDKVIPYMAVSAVVVIVVMLVLGAITTMLVGVGSIGYRGF